MSDDAVSVRHLRQYQHRMQVNWPNGRVGWMLFGEAAQWTPFLVTDVGVEHFIVDNQRLYRALLKTVLLHLTSRTDRPLLLTPKLILFELWALAADQSADEVDRDVRLDELTENDVSHDGAAFTRAYRMQKYPGAFAK